jgi:exonuclease VII large subunit
MLTRGEEKLREYNPNRALKLGYSLIRSGEKLVRSIQDVKKGDSMEIRVADGLIGAEVRSVTENS